MNIKPPSDPKSEIVVINWDNGDHLVTLTEQDARSLYALLREHFDPGKKEPVRKCCGAERKECCQ